MNDPLSFHHSALVIDGHADTPQRFIEERWEFTDPLGEGMLSLDTARAGGLSAEFFAIWAEPTQWKGRYAERTLALIDGVLAQARKHPQQLRLCVCANDILQSHRDGTFAVLMGVEGGHSIENDLSRLRQYFDLGVRYMTLTWSNTNEWADSSGDQHDPDIHHHGGLTPFGCAVVTEMNRLGMMVDVSHVSNETLAAVLAVTTAPIIASHSSALALTHSDRNLSDDQLRAIAGQGGLIMVNFFPAFIDEAWRRAWNLQRPKRILAHERLQQQYTGTPIPFHISNRIDREFAARLPRAPLASLIDHIDHVARVAGIDHVGVGTDFDGIPSLPEGLDSAADLPKVTAALLTRGYTADDLRKILGENLLRVFRAVEAAAVRL